MIFRFSELINIFLCFWFLFLIIRKQGKGLSFYLFVYCSLHFSYAAVPMLVGESLEDIKQVHLDGGGFFAGLSSVLILLSSVFLLLKQCGKEMLKDRALFSVFFFVLLAIAIGCLHGGVYIESSVLKSICALFFLLILLFLLAQKSYDFDWDLNRMAIYVLLLLQAVMLLVAFYELYSLRAWAWFGDNNGVRIYRSSSLLFNPNLYGMWCVILAIGFAYLLHKGNVPVWITLLGMSLSFAGIFVSGSRSAGLLMLFLLIGIGLLIKGGCFAIRWLPVPLMILIFCVIGFGAEWASKLFPSQYESLHTTALLGDRFASYPSHLVNYGLSKFSLSSGTVPEHISISIEGIFTGELRDSGWLVLYDDAGWAGALSLAILWCTFCYWGIKAYRREQSLVSIYALAILFFSIGVGVVMRFQMFPLAIFIAIVLAPCIRYWRSAILFEDSLSPKPQKIVSQAS